VAARQKPSPPCERFFAYPSPFLLPRLAILLGVRGPDARRQTDLGRVLNQTALEPPPSLAGAFPTLPRGVSGESANTRIGRRRKSGGRGVRSGAGRSLNMACRLAITYARDAARGRNWYRTQAQAFHEVGGSALRRHSVGKRVQKRQLAPVDIIEGFIYATNLSRTWKTALAPRLPIRSC
jgi:hypothetical protein